MKVTLAPPHPLDLSKCELKDWIESRIRWYEDELEKYRELPSSDKNVVDNIDKKLIGYKNLQEALKEKELI